MAEHVHTTYSCDRCKCDLGQERPKRGQVSVVDARFDYTEGPGPSFCWRDLCDRCFETVTAFFLPLAAPKQSEKADARKMFSDLLAAANNDAADWIMVKARRMLGGWKP